MSENTKTADICSKEAIEKRRRAATRADATRHHRGNDHRFDPCIEEGLMSLDCTSTKGLDACDLEIQNYKNCVSFWQMVVRDRGRNGIKPQLPEPKDRETVREQYISLMNKLK